MLCYAIANACSRLQAVEEHIEVEAGDVVADEDVRIHLESGHGRTGLDGDEGRDGEGRGRHGQDWKGGRQRGRCRVKQRFRRDGKCSCLHTARGDAAAKKRRLYARSRRPCCPISSGARLVEAGEQEAEEPLLVRLRRENESAGDFRNGMLRVLLLDLRTGNTDREDGQGGDEA